MKPEDPAYLHHILDAISPIEKFGKNISSAEELKDHPLERAGIERMLSIIGEAAKNVSPQLLERRPGYSLEGNGRHARQTHPPLFWRGLRSGV